MPSTKRFSPDYKGIQSKNERKDHFKPSPLPPTNTSVRDMVFPVKKKKPVQPLPDNYNQLPRAKRRELCRLYTMEQEEWVTDQVFNTISHGVGALALLLRLPRFFSLCQEHNRVGLDLVVLIFWYFSVINIFLASCLYHGIGLSGLKFKPYRYFRLWDHVSIFIITIASIMAICRMAVESRKGNICIIVALVTGFISIGLKLYYKEKQSNAQFLICILLVGWTPTLITREIVAKLGTKAMEKLVVMGLTFTVGAGIYWYENIVIIPGKFSAHEIWHIFVMSGLFQVVDIVDKYAIPR